MLLCHIPLYNGGDGCKAELGGVGERDEEGQGDNRGRMGGGWEDSVVCARTRNVFTFTAVTRKWQRRTQVREILDGLQVGLPIQSTFEHLRRWSGWCSALGVLTAVGCPGLVRSERSRAEEGIWNQENQPRI